MTIVYHGQTALKPFPITLSALHLDSSISALHFHSGLEVCLPASDTSPSLRLKVVIVESTTRNLILKSFYDAHIADKTFNGIQYKSTPLLDLGISRCAFATASGWMQGQPKLDDQNAPQFKVDGLTRITFQYEGQSFSPQFFTCDHIFSRHEYESQFVAVLGLEFLKEYFVRAQWTETGWDMRLVPNIHRKNYTLDVYIHLCRLTSGAGHVRSGYGIRIPSLRWGMRGAPSSDIDSLYARTGIIAAIRALQFLRKRKIFCAIIRIFINSEYAVKGLNEYIPTWRENGYRTFGGDEVVNADLFKSLDKEVLLLKHKKIQVTMAEIGAKAKKASYKIAVDISSSSARDDFPTLSVPDRQVNTSNGSTQKMMLGRDLMIHARPWVQWTPDGSYWVSHQSLDGWEPDFQVA